MNFVSASAVGSIAALLALTGAAQGQETVYGVTDNGSLVSWDSATPGTIDSGVAIMGLASNEVIRGIDFRPANGQLYAMGSFSNLYTLNINSGQASLVGGGFGGPGTTLNGSSFGFDFNPVIDRIRVVSDADQNLVLNPMTGGATLVTSLFYGPGDSNEGTNPNVVASAYTNSVANAGSTQLYGIDTALDILVTQANSAGTLGTVGDIGFDVTDTASFDISGTTGIAYLVIENETLSRSTFWTIDLSSGAARAVGEIGGGAVITSMAVIPAPAGLGVLAAGGMLAARRRR